MILFLHLYSEGEEGLVGGLIIPDASTATKEADYTGPCGIAYILLMVYKIYYYYYYC